MRIVAVPPPVPSVLPENRELAFVGERVPPSLQLDGAELRAILTSRNPHGKPNLDVVRRYLGADGVEKWMIDFPPDMDARIAALYVAPFALATARAADWAGRRAHRALRTALARLPRYLAAPCGDELLFEWVDSELLPDDTLLAVARDDDFAHGLLCSRWFRAWWHAFGSAENPAEAVNSFPFPWRAEAISQLTRAQEDAKFALARAARSGDEAAIDDAADCAYGWAAIPPGREVEALLDLHRDRCGQR